MQNPQNLLRDKDLHLDPKPKSSRNRVMLVLISIPMQTISLYFGSRLSSCVGSSYCNSPTTSQEQLEHIHSGFSLYSIQKFISKGFFFLKRGKKVIRCVVVAAGRCRLKAWCWGSFSQALVGQVEKKCGIVKFQICFIVWRGKNWSKDFFIIFFRLI